MKLYISQTYFTDEYGYKGNEDSQDITAENFKMNAQKASSRVNVLTTRAIEKGIVSGIYFLNNNLITVADTIDPTIKVEEEQKIDAVREAICLMTQFAIDTGYDFITGSFSSSLGAEAMSDTVDFEASKDSLETTIKELLGVYEWENTLIEGENVQVGFDGEEEAGLGHDGEDTPLTLKQYYTHHANDHVAKPGGGVIITKDVTNGVVTFSVDPDAINGNLSVDDTEIIATEAHITETEEAYDDDILTQARVE